MSNERQPRKLETREQEKRQVSWKAPEVLPTPDVNAHPDYTFRWVRVSTMGDGDASNIASMLRQGYEPCKAEDYPELQVDAITEGRFKGNVEIGGLMLCRIPKELLEQRAAHYNQVNKQQIDSVNAQFMKENDARMPLFSDVKTKVSKSAFGSGS